MGRLLFENSYDITVDYGINIENLLERGQYKQFSCNDRGLTSKNFPTNRKGKKNIKVEIYEYDNGRRGALHYGHWLTEFDEVIDDLRKHGFRPLEGCELLTLGMVKPELQIQFPMVALGSIGIHSDTHPYSVVGIGTYRNILPLYESSENRCAILWTIHDKWEKQWRFPAVRE